MNNNLFNNLIATVRSQNDDKALKDLLKGLLTPQEIETFSTRLEIAKLLKQKMPQREIAKKLGIGIATVTRGSRELQSGSFKNI
ncbi:MAG: helix-turn-helix domain-containing protein [Candidatus Pacebacteria bacterium]|nr:helix-turn-helix domain-containing protein [Candidatus Paceibacterota bacterium]PIR59506.1 MAG: transcriptional regulator [Candidatus Pacebacteria bacterium CG10_big_fil_rev_8_21_14_0_10_45_6]